MLRGIRKPDGGGAWYGGGDAIPADGNSVRIVQGLVYGQVQRLVYDLCVACIQKDFHKDVVDGTS